MYIPFGSWSLKNVAYRNPCIHTYRFIKMDTFNSVSPTFSCISISLCSIIKHKIPTFYFSIFDNKRNILTSHPLQQKKHFSTLERSAYSKSQFLSFYSLLNRLQSGPLLLTQNCSCQGHPHRQVMSHDLTLFTHFL